MQTTASRLRRLPRHHRRWPCRADDRAAARRRGPSSCWPRCHLSEGAASAWAQGGIAAAVGEDDRPALHAADTLAAGAGLSDPAVASRIAAAAPAAIIELERHGVAFDRDPAGRLALGLEAAHARRRIVHVAGDGTGAAIMRALVAAVQATPSITVIEGLEARRLLVDDRGVAGVLAAGPPTPACCRARRGRAGDRRAGRALRPHHQPAGRHRPGPGAGRAGRRRAGRPGVRAVPSHRPRCRARSHAAGHRGPARRGGGAGRRDRRALHGRPCSPAARARAARRRRARDGGAHRGRPPRLPRCPADARRGLRKTFPRYHRALPGRRHRSRAPADPGASGGALPHGRHRRGRRGPQHRRGPVGLRRGRRNRPARRQSPGQQLAARGGGHGERGGRQHRRHRAGAAAGAAAGRPAAGAGRDGPARPDQRDAGRRARPRRPRARGRRICSRSPSRAEARPIRRWSP